MNLLHAQQKLIDAGLEARAPQREMMVLIDKAILQRKIAVIEGGTGVGKTFGYLVPAILQRKSKIRIVIATATVSLQEQLAHHDIPRLAKMLDLDIKVAIAKGRGRYVCEHKLHQAASGANQVELSLFGIEGEQQSQQDLAVLNDILTLYKQDQWAGDIDTLPIQVERDTWQKITNDALGCTKKECAFFKRCAFFLAKRDLRDAEIIVTNHDLLLSDLLRGGGVALPKPEQCLYIIDEAHHLPQKALQQLSANIHTQTSNTWLKGIAKSLYPIADAIDFSMSSMKQADEAIAELTQLHQDWTQFLNANFEAQTKDDIWLMQRVPEAALQMAQSLLKHSQQLQSVLYQMREIIAQQHSAQTLAEYDVYCQLLGFYITQCDRFVECWGLFCRVDQAGQAPIARWITRDPLRRGVRLSYTTSASMTTASTSLPHYLWDVAPNGMVLCSATLRALGKFDNFCVQTGLLKHPRLITGAFASPFPYHESKLVIPQMQTVPKGDFNDQHAFEVANLLPQLLEHNQAGSLVLFTSFRMMENVIKELNADFMAHVLVQGEQNRQEMLKQHKAKIDQQEKSIIFGLQSFAEGVDLPGGYCEHVVITKLPFTVPTGPIAQTRSRWLENQGRKPFMEESLPEASLRLTQFVGRLIRTSEDRGQVTILDRRIVSKFYGQQLLAGLPAFERVVQS